jgi:hypothetical protein
MTRPLSFALVLAALFAPTAAAAQRAVLVLPWSAGDDDPVMLAARAEAARSGLSSSELSALALEEVRRRFEADGSTAPPSVTEEEVDRWLSLSRAAVRHLAGRDYTAARASLAEAQLFSERAAPELDREEARARQVLDTCLYDVRAYVETHDGRAGARTMECRRLVPRVAPSAYNHTPEVVELLAQIDRGLAGDTARSLHVDSPRAGCAVRLNGVEVGVTPFTSTALPSGEYAVQVECDRRVRGRVHRAIVGEGASTVEIDPRFDSVVRTDGVLRLAYRAASDADERRLEDAVRAATIAGAAEVWLLSIEAGDVVRIDRVVAASRTPLASIRANGLAGLSSAVASLAEARSEDRTSSETVAISRWRGGAVADESEPARSDAWGRADWEVSLGIGAGLLAMTSFAVGLGLADENARLGRASALLSPTDPQYLPSRDAWQAERTLSWSFAAAGGALGALAVSLAMEEEHGAPWWSWVIGGIGLAGAGAGAALVGTAAECGNEQPGPACIEGSQRLDLGVSAISLSAPLLAVPLVFLVRDVVRGAPMPSIDVTPQSAMISVLGSF